MTVSTPHRATFSLANADATSDLASHIALTLCPGDVILLQGPIGAGKTHFARSLIQSLMAEPEDVPSPTFTLVQVYDVPTCELWHADLYRLSHVDEVEELGLLAAFEEAICLIEWPDRLEALAPQSALTLSLSLSPDHDDARICAVTWSDPKWSPRMEGLAT